MPAGWLGWACAQRSAAPTSKAPAGRPALRQTDRADIAALAVQAPHLAQSCKRVLLQHVPQLLQPVGAAARHPPRVQAKLRQDGGRVRSGCGRHQRPVLLPAAVEDQLLHARGRCFLHHLLERVPSGSQAFILPGGVAGWDQASRGVQRSVQGAASQGASRGEGRPAGRSGGERRRAGQLGAKARFHAPVIASLCT